MQADEIIQQKEWHQLSAGEKETVRELAANEQEFNLLKKMLQVSAEEVRLTPTVDPRIKENLVTAIGGTKRNSRKMYWWATAAAVLLIAFAGLFLLQKKQTQIAVKKEPVEKNIPQTSITKKENTINKDSLVIVKQTPPRNDTALIVKSNNPARLKKSYHVLPQQDVYAVVNTRISNDKELLSLVTEIY